MWCVPCKYDAFTRKWICKFIALFSVWHRVNESEEMFWNQSFVKKELPKLKKCDLFSAHLGCERLQREPCYSWNFDNNMECCIAKESGYTELWFLWRHQNGLNKNGLKLGSRFCEDHLQDHYENRQGWYKVKAGEISVECNRINFHNIFC